MTTIKTYYCIVIDCATQRPITYDNDNNITNAVVDYCFENLNSLQKFLIARWYESKFSNELSFSETMVRDKYVKQIIEEMNKQNNKLVRNDKLSANDSCCHYWIFKTTNKSIIKDCDNIIEKTKLKLNN